MAQPRVIDADGHVMEFTINWKEVLPEPLGQKALWATQQGSRVYWPEPIVRETEGPMGPWHQDPERSGMWDPHRRMKDMDLEGIDVAVLFGGGTGLGVSGLQDRRLAAGMARGYNDWLAEYCAPYPDRLKGAAALPMQDIPAAVEELRRSVKEYGFVGACIPVNVHGKTLDDPDYFPFYEAAQDMDIPVCIHNTIFIEGPGWERFTSFVRQKAILDPFEMMIASMSLVMGRGVRPLPQAHGGFPGVRGRVGPLLDGPAGTTTTKSSRSCRSRRASGTTSGVSSATSPARLTRRRLTTSPIRSVRTGCSTPLTISTTTASSPNR